MRLREVKKELGDKLRIVNKAFMLRPDWKPGQKPQQWIIDSWAKVEAQGQDVGIRFGRLSPDQAYPAGSLPALAAAKCAARQGPEAFDRMDLALMRAYFEETRDISDRAVLVDVAREAGLDMAQFEADFDSGIFQPAVLAEYQEAHERYGINGIPTIVIDDKWKLVGAVPLEEYRRAFDLVLSGELEARTQT